MLEFHARTRFDPPMQQVLDYLDANQDRFLEELKQYLRIPSVSAQPNHAADVQSAAKWVSDHCNSIGLHAAVHSTPGHPVVVASTRSKRKTGSKKPHFLVYGHYDVQPAEPFELWNTPPFEPTIQNGNIYARGSTDNKGQHFAHIKAVEGWLKTGTKLPCDITILLEGEEEVGSPNLAPFLRSHKDQFEVDAVVVSDTGMPGPKHPALTYALRGVAALEVHLYGPDRDLHSGIYGGAVDNPAMVLCQMLGSLRDPDGGINVPGFYDGVQELADFERRQAERHPLTESRFRKLVGAKALFGESGYNHLEQCSARPTLEINGLTSGYQGVGSKTIVPAKASAKLTMRLVPNQKPAKVVAAVKRRLRELCPPSIRMEIEGGHEGEPYYMDPTGPLAKAGIKALREAFGHEPILLREGGSIPIVNDFKKILKADTLLLGLALPDDNLHSPNEKFSLANFSKGIRMSARLWQDLSV